MRLVVDASVLVGEALRLRGRRLLADPQLDLVIAEETWSETVHGLQRRVDLLVAAERVEPAAATELLDAAANLMRACVTVASSELYAERLDEARRRIPRDVSDAPTVALGLALDCGIWTADQDFFGCGLPVWTTETLLAQLGVDPGP